MTDLGDYSSIKSQILSNIPSDFIRKVLSLHSKHQYTLAYVYRKTY